MPTRNISLTPEQDAFVQKVVEAGASTRMRVRLSAMRFVRFSSAGEKMR